MGQRRVRIRGKPHHVFKLTANSLYGDSEELIGKWFKRTGKRDDIFLATKFGFVKGSKTYELNISYEYAKKACAESLRVLDVDCIDLCKSTPGRYEIGIS